uniref:RGS domain-containing protein n=1 Tax=Strigamia maritima TaxID=126957 RepID=T1JE93_STRMM
AYSEVDKKWIRISSLPNCKQVSLHSTEIDGISSCEDFVINGFVKSSNSMMGGLGVSNSKSITTQGSSRVANWALSFDKLLEDSAGIHTFAVFLKREFSYENIRFWVACERYKVFAISDEVMKIKAKEIFQSHLCIGAIEPVNVDSQAQQIAEENLDNPSRDIFIPAQKQIYNLMKFDCYSRFLKSPIYKDALLKEISDEPLLHMGDDDLDPSLPYTNDNITLKGQKDKIIFEERRRKSLLSWNRAKKIENVDTRKSTRKKCKDKKDDIDMHGSRSSLANGDLATIQRYTTSRESLNGVETCFSEDGCTLCRVLLPDESTAVVQTKYNESVIGMIRNLMKRRNFDFTAVDVYLVDSNKIVGLYEDCRLLSNLEIRIEERILFRLTLPNKKTLFVKNDCDQIIRTALQSVLNRCGFKMESVIVMTCNNQEIDLNLPSRNFDKQCLIVDLKEKQLEWGLSNSLIRRKAEDNDPTSRLFDDIVNDKFQPQWDEYGVWDTDKINDNKNSLERMSAGLLGVVRRNSLNFERDVKKVKNKNRASIHESLNHRITQQQPVTEKPPIHKAYKKEIENNVDIYQVWERAQRSRLDDQRGTEINFDMPDFLKPQPKKMPVENRTSEPLIRSKFYDEQKNNLVIVDGFSGNSVIPTVEQAEDFFSAKSADCITFSSKDEPSYCTRKKLSMTSNPSTQFTVNKVSIVKPERTLSLPGHDLCQKLNDDLKDDSLTPSKIAPPSNINDTSLHVEEANFTPPPRLQLPTPPNTPPPLPPKPKYFPSRPSYEVKSATTAAQDLSKKRTTKEANNNHKVRSRRAMDFIA